MNKWLIRLIALIAFVICIALIVTGQRTVGVSHLMKMMAGLLGLLALLFAYNKTHQ
ncbi:MAG: hypothetical protein HFH13_14190 [Dorea sp.]|jgi:hypothetical protein|nr:hypothetical protein [Dorea sp.]